MNLPIFSITKNLLSASYYGASNGIRTRIFCMASRNTNHYTIPAFMEPIVRFERTWTFVSWLQITCNRPLCDIGILERKEKSSVSSFNLTHPRWSYTTFVRSWSSECSIGEAGIVFTWLLMLVYEPVDGMTGLEPATFWMAIRCSSQTELHSDGAGKELRYPDLLLTRQLLCRWAMPAFYIYCQRNP